MHNARDARRTFTNNAHRKLSVGISTTVAIAVAGTILFVVIAAAGLLEIQLRPSPRPFRTSSASQLMQKPPLTSVGGADPPIDVRSAPPALDIIEDGCQGRQTVTKEDRAAVEEFLTSKMRREVRIMRVTAYCQCEKCCGKWANVPPTERRLASGVKLWDQLVTGTLFCAAPGEIPFHAAIAIPGYNGGFCVPVLDRGGAIVGDRIDVFIPDHAAARAWGAPLLQVVIYYTQDPPEAEADSPDGTPSAFTTEYE